MNSKANGIVYFNDKIDFAWKIMVMGDGGVGKTTFLHQYVFKEFLEDTKLTIGCGFYSQFVERNGSKVNLSIWDLGGQDRFDAVHHTYANGTSLALLLYDMNRLETLLNVDKWIRLIRKNNGDGVPIVIVGTKRDLVDDEEDVGEIQKLVSDLVVQHGLKSHIVTSAKMELNVKETIDYVVDVLLYING